MVVTNDNDMKKNAADKGTDQSVDREPGKKRFLADDMFPMIMHFVGICIGVALCLFMQNLPDMKKVSTESQKVSAGEVNPYKGDDTVIFVVGDQFAYIDSYDSKIGAKSRNDGYVVKADTNSKVNVPIVVAKPGYTFMGWSYGGTSDPDVQPYVKEITVTRDDPNKKGTTTLFGLFKDSAGNGYCTCGDYVEGYWAEN